MIQPQAKDILNMGKERQAEDGTTIPELPRLQMGFDSRALSYFQTQPKPAVTTSMPERRAARISVSHNYLIPLPIGVGSLPQHLSHSHLCHKIPERPSSKISTCLASSHAH